MEPSDASQKVPITVERFASQMDALPPDGARSFAVGVSGGSDSTALLLLAAEYARARSMTLHVLTVDHGLRPESAEEADMVAGLAGRLGATHSVLRWAEAKPTSNIAATARRARYRLMREWRIAHRIKTLAVAHTADDVAETFLLRLARGSGVDGLAEMSSFVDEGDGLRLIRPLLDVTRTDLRALCRERGVVWINDPSNDDQRFDRPKARKALEALAPLGLTVDRLMKTARSMRRARRALEAEAKALTARAQQWNVDLRLMTLSAGALAGAEREIGLRVLAAALRRVAGAPYPPRLEAVEAAFDALCAGSCKRTLHGCVVERTGIDDVISVAREPKACAPRQELNPGDAVVWDNRFEVQTVRRRLCVGALGSAGVARLKRDDTLLCSVDAWLQAPLAAKRSACAVFLDDTIYAAPAAGLLTPDVNIRPIE